MIKLKNILLEDPRKVRKGAEKLYAWMKDPLSALGANPTGQLATSAKRLVTKGKQDGDESDDTTIVAGGLQYPSVAKIQASQNEVGMRQSLANVMTGVNGMTFDGIDYGDVNWLIDAMKPGAKIEFKDADNLFVFIISFSSFTKLCFLKYLFFIIIILFLILS